MKGATIVMGAVAIRGAFFPTLSAEVLVYSDFCLPSFLWCTYRLSRIALTRGLLWSPRAVVIILQTHWLMSIVVHTVRCQLRRHLWGSFFVVPADSRPSWHVLFLPYREVINECILLPGAL
jgi:hypothetical protein